MKNLFSMNARSVLLAVMMGSTVSLSAQTGPGGIGTTDGTSHLKLWLRADKGVFSDAGETAATNGSAVQQWNDQSGNNLHVMQNIASWRPQFSTTGFNGFPALSFSAGPTLMTAALNINPSVRPNITVIAVTSSPYIGYEEVPFSKLWGNDDGGYDRSIGFDPRASGGKLGYFTGFSVGNMPFQAGTPSSIEPFISTAMYSTTHFTGYLQGAISVSDTANNGDGQSTFTIGAINDEGIESWSGDIVEMIVFDTLLTEAQRTNIENYLSAKYNTAFFGSDIYVMDNPANGDFDYDVAGIHYFFGDSQNIIRTARGTGIVTLSNASNLVEGGSYFIGHNNGSLQPVTTDLPSGIVNRLGRIWAGTENEGDVGTLDLSFELPGLVVSDPANLRLLIDRNNNGVFSDEEGDGVVSGFTRSGNTYTINVNMGNGQRFTIGSVSTLTLPVNLRSIGVEKDGQNNRLQWKTERETGFAYFEVQRSEDGMNFYKIGAVQASKSTTAVKDYSFTDNSPLPANYYRLKMIDQQGQFSYSAVVKMIQTNKRFTISPNPATNIVSVTGLDGTATTIQLLDMNGKLLEQAKTTGLQHSFYLTKYPKGTYHIKVSTAKISFTETIVKQ